MPSASTTQKLKGAEKGLSRASSVSKTEPESAADSTENNYLKELQKTLRNANKKLNASAKVDAIITENPGKSLDQLIEEKKINNDQKAQHLKRPTLQATVAQAEEQIAHYKQFAAQYEERLVAQKAELTKAHEEELEAVRANAIADATETSKKALRQKLYTLTKFLCGAATLRLNGDANDTESQAFEGALFQVYGGSQEAVNSMVKIIDGVDEKIIGVERNMLEFTYADLKQACDRFAAAEEDSDVSSETIPASDPTLANAGLTELQDPSLENTVSKPAQADQLAPPAQTLISDAANSIAEKSSGAAELDESDLVELPRDPAETDTGLQATPASADAGLTNSSVGADVSAEGVQENGAAKKSGGRRRHNNRSREQREGQQGPREGQQAPREGQKPQREGQQGQREGQQGPREGQRGRGRGPRGEGRGRGGRGRGRGGPSGTGNGSAEASAPAPAPAASA